MERAASRFFASSAGSSKIRVSLPSERASNSLRRSRVFWRTCWNCVGKSRDMTTRTVTRSGRSFRVRIAASLRVNWRSRVRSIRPFTYCWLTMARAVRNTSNAMPPIQDDARALSFLEAMPLSPLPGFDVFHVEVQEKPDHDDIVDHVAGIQAAPQDILEMGEQAQVCPHGRKPSHASQPVRSDAGHEEQEDHGHGRDEGHHLAFRQGTDPQPDGE